MKILNKKNRFFLIFLVSFISLFSRIGLAENKCFDLFWSDPFLKINMSQRQIRLVEKSVASLTNSTTGARKEVKWTVENSQIQRLISEFNERLALKGITLKMRDTLTLGYRNVTVTTYLEKFSIPIKNTKLKVSSDYKRDEITFKIRIRKYGLVKNDQDMSFDHIEYAEFTKNHSFLEFKFSDPRVVGAVFKPRLYMSDKNIEHLQSTEFEKLFDQIKKETLALKQNQGSLDSASAMLDFLLKSHQKKYSFKPIAKNLYERTSYAVDLFDQSKKQNLQLQMTVDQSIEFYVPFIERSLRAYSPQLSVVELKIPVEYSNFELSSKEIQSIEGFQDFLEFLTKVKMAHQNDYIEGVGKMGHGHRAYLEISQKWKSNLILDE